MQHLHILRVSLDEPNIAHKTGGGFSDLEGSSAVPHASAAKAKMVHGVELCNRYSGK